LESYEHEHEKTRREARFSFSGVKNFNSIANITDISDQGKAGNVNYITSSESGVTYIYLVNGSMEISAESLEIV
jgi:hypothetical protein